MTALDDLLAAVGDWLALRDEAQTHLAHGARPAVVIMAMNDGRVPDAIARMRAAYDAVLAERDVLEALHTPNAP